MDKKEYNKLYKLVFKEFNEDNKISNYEELIEYLKEMRTFKPESNKEMKSEKTKTELYALSCVLLAFALRSSQDNIKEEFKHYSTVYYTLLTIISNDCLAVVKLLENGFEFQSQIIVRNLIELVYTLLVVIINKTKCSEYFDSARLENEYDVWNRHFRMSKLNEELYIFEKSDFIVSNNYKDWNNALFITVLLDEEKKKEMENDNFES